jgi:hypothetical protein
MLTNCKNGLFTISELEIWEVTGFIEEEIDYYIKEVGIVNHKNKIVEKIKGQQKEIEKNKKELKNAEY